MSFIKFCLLVAITIAGIKCKNTANWLEDIWLSFLLTVVLIFFLYFQLSILPQRDRRGGRDWDITDSGDGQVLGAVRWRSWETETTSAHTKVRHRVNWTGRVFLFNIHIVLTIIYILIIDCIFLSSLTAITRVSDKPEASLYWSRSQLIGSLEFVLTTPAQVLYWLRGLIWARLTTKTSSMAKVSHRHRGAANLHL